MVMCHMGYRTMSKDDFPTFDDWIRAVNDNQRYCAALPKHRMAEYRFKCLPSSLPSFHPYWKRKVHLDKMRRGQRHIENLKACRRDPSLIKVLYNLSTTLADIEAMANAVPKRRQSW